MKKVFLQLPLKTEVKVEISGLYITAIKSVPRGGLIHFQRRKRSVSVSKEFSKRLNRQEKDKIKKPLF